MIYYRLVGHEPEPCTLMEWRPPRHVGDTEIGIVRVSTVFIGVAPVLFETMIFGGEHHGYQDRCETWVEAEAMHERACVLVRLKLIMGGK